VNLLVMLLDCLAGGSAAFGASLTCELDDPGAALSAIAVFAVPALVPASALSFCRALKSCSTSNPQHTASLACFALTPQHLQHLQILTLLTLSSTSGCCRLLAESAQDVWQDCWPPISHVNRKKTCRDKQSLTRDAMGGVAA